MKRYCLWLLLPLLLAACAKPKLEFRGYSDLSSCTEIIDAELANGANFQGGFASQDIENPGYITELSGTLFDESVRIEILCDVRGYIGSIHYISHASDPRDTGAVFHRFADELDQLFGEPTAIATEDGRSLRYLCHSDSPVLLDEWRVPEEAPEDPEAEPPHEVYLAVMPLAAECLDESANSK